MLQLKKAFDEFDNLYLYNSSDLTSFYTNKLAIKEQTKSLYKIKVAGKQQFKDYWNVTVVNKRSAISNKIKSNKSEMLSTSKLKKILQSYTKN